MGALIVELREAGLANERVRGAEPAPGDAEGPPGPSGEPSYQRFIVLSHLGGIRLHRAPLQWPRVGVRCYGATPQDAQALWGELTAYLDNRGPRVTSSGVATYQSLDDTGGAGNFDPDTHQPYTEGVIQLIAATQVVTV